MNSDRSDPPTCSDVIAAPLGGSCRVPVIADLAFDVRGGRGYQCWYAGRAARTEAHLRQVSFMSARVR